MLFRTESFTPIRRPSCGTLHEIDQMRGCCNLSFLGDENIGLFWLDFP
jgi:hypothetical protein